MRCIKSKETVKSAEKPLQDPSKTSCSYVNETLSIRHESTLNWYIVLKKKRSCNCSLGKLSEFI